MTTPASRAAGIVDVARRAGVSVSTVSRSLRGTANVSPRTRERVLQAARELAYVPSPAAAGLASGRTGAVGVIAPFTTRWFFAEVLAGVESALREAGHDLLLYNIGDPAARCRFFEVLPVQRRVDGVLAVASALTEAECAGLLGLRVPVVTIGPGCSGLARVGVDDEAGVATAVEHLLGLGHRDVAMISGPPDDPVGRVTTAARRSGYRTALERAGIAPRAERIVAGPWGAPGGAQAAERLLALGPPPTAVVVESDETALGVLQALRRAGLAVPGRVSVVGFDDDELAAAADLTTVAQPVREQGERAVRLLLDGRDGGGTAADVALPTHLVVRGSTGPAKVVP